MFPHPQKTEVSADGATPVAKTCKVVNVFM